MKNLRDWIARLPGHGDESLGTRGTATEAGESARLTGWGGPARGLVGLGFLASGLCVSSLAHAQAQTFALDRAQISGAPDDGFMAHRPFMERDGFRLYGNMAVGYAHAPLRKDAVATPLAQQQMDDPVQGQFLVYPSVGIEVLGRLGFNLHLPFVPYQFTGTDPIDANVGQGGLTGQHANLGDFRVDARAMVWRSESGKTAFGAEGFFTVPVGTDQGFGSDGGGSAQLLATFEQHFDKFFLVANLGPHFRPLNGIYGSEGVLRIGNELRFALAGYLPLREDTLRLGLEFWGGTGLETIDGQNTFFSQRNTFIEWLVQARVFLDEEKRLYANAGGGTRLSAGYGSADFRLLVSLGYYFHLTDAEPAAPPPTVAIQSRPEHYETDSDGDGYPDGIDNCPRDKEDGRGPRKTDGCPGEADKDEDGIPDRLDKCPDRAEDFDKLKDKDGCPEDDADNDKVLDKADKCPLEPGPPNADRAKNGCPTLTKVSEDGSIALLKNIEFDLGRATIKPVSYPILNEVVTLLKARDDLRLAINGYTDSQGDRNRNMQLSKERAGSVRQYLIAKGINAARLESAGFGPDKAIDTNDTAEGRARNRRVEFIIVEQDEAAGADW